MLGRTGFVTCPHEHSVTPIHQLLQRLSVPVLETCYLWFLDESPLTSLTQINCPKSGHTVLYLIGQKNKIKWCVLLNLTEPFHSSLFKSALHAFWEVKLMKKVCWHSGGPGSGLRNPGLFAGGTRKKKMALWVSQEPPDCVLHLFDAERAIILISSP